MKKLILVGFILFLLAVAVSADVTFTDDFSSGNASNWSMVAGSVKSENAGIQYNEQYVPDNTVSAVKGYTLGRMRNQSSNDLWTWTLSTVNNYQFADLNLTGVISADTPTVDTYLIFGFKDSKNYSLFGFENNSLAIRYVVNGFRSWSNNVPELLPLVSPLYDINDGSLHTYGLTITGNDLTCYFDNDTIGSLTLDNYTGGQIGFCSIDGLATLRTIAVTGNPVAPVPEPATFVGLIAFAPAGFALLKRKKA